MTKISVFLVLLAILGFVTPARAQAVEEMEFNVSRDFGSSDGTGNIQGTFSMKVTGPSNLVKVQFYMDNTMIAEDTESPFKVQFVTDNYAPGKHTMHAIGHTSDGSELRTREMTFNYMTAEESWQRGLKIVLPILVLVFIWKLFSSGVPILSRGNKKGDLLSPGKQNYGFIGGTICPGCAHPFALNLFSPNLLVGKLVRCRTAESGLLAGGLLPTICSLPKRLPGGRRTGRQRSVTWKMKRRSEKDWMIRNIKINNF